MHTQSSATMPSQVMDLLRNTGRLLRNEAVLAREELADNFSRAGVAIALVAVGAFIALIALIVFTGAAVAGLVAAGFELWLAALIVGGAMSLIALILVVRGLYDLRSKRLMPTRSFANMQKDIAVLKEALDA
ncbi:phage holin family protein [Hasllibacter sp. MH4015]|uniref:phage holin family protein n=1 Tax=Hasllibacter sp. MH4015 TaxID=2854029 RepID=UPI001CD1EB1F|nr:phage holin family protein [Hasllibacter sp. MH4015]